MAPLITVQCGPDDKPAKDTGRAANWDSNTVLVYLAKFYSRIQGSAYRENAPLPLKFPHRVPKNRPGRSRAAGSRRAGTFK